MFTTSRKMKFDNYKMKYRFICFFLFALIGCNSQLSESSIMEIDPRTFSDNEINLAKIADDIRYVPLDYNEPLGIHYDCKIVNDKIYTSFRNVGVISFDTSGKFLQKYGNIGRGAEEYIYCHSFTVDENSGSVYVMDHNQKDIEVYSQRGDYLRSLKLPKADDGFWFEEIESFNSLLFVSQIFNMGHAQNCWVVIDSLGTVICEKKNPIPSFDSRFGVGANLSKLKDHLLYWDTYADTVYAINPDYTYTTPYLFSAGEHRMPHNNFNPKIENNKIDIPYFVVNQFFETKLYLLCMYGYQNSQYLAVIDKTSHGNYVTQLYLDDKVGGMKNDIDAGVPFCPEYYYSENGNEYLVSTVNAYELIEHANSPEFQNTTPQYPGKKAELEELAKSLNENDNPVLMLVKLKE